MTDHDVLAHERFRTILTDAIRETGYTAAGMGVEADPEVAAGKSLEVLPVAHFEREINEHGVAVRRVHVIGEWEVDPQPDHTEHMASRAVKVAEQHDVFRR